MYIYIYIHISLLKIRWSLEACIQSCHVKILVAYRPPAVWWEKWWNVEDENQPLSSSSHSMPVLWLYHYWEYIRYPRPMSMHGMPKGLLRLQFWWVKFADECGYQKKESTIKLLQIYGEPYIWISEHSITVSVLDIWSSYQSKQITKVLWEYHASEDDMRWCTLPIVNQYWSISSWNNIDLQAYTYWERL